MKKLLSWLLVAGLAVLGSAPALAGVGDSTQTSTNTGKTVNVTNTTTIGQISGKANKKLAPNFWDNDWDQVWDGQGNRVNSKYDLGLSESEISYLQSVSGLSAGKTYYVDLVNNVVSTSAFQNSSSTSSSTDVSIAGQSGIGDSDGGLFVLHTDYLTTTTVTTDNTVYQSVGHLFDSSPLLLDLNGDRRADVAEGRWLPHSPKFYKAYAKSFDITGDGVEDLTEWTAPALHDGLLVMPENNRVDGALQLFGTAGGYEDGFQKLALVCDKDGNGWVQGAELEGLYVWQDKNNDAGFQPEELRGLSEYGIVKLSTRHSNFVSRYVTQDGKEHTMWDWWPATMEVRKLRPAH
ncbi:MAG: hypothetical protein HY319_23375 [Armatimonadetes bacterium]|nr:hypothetical protein [Armatimonadota bacterium]